MSDNETNVARPEGFHQVCVWPATVVGGGEKELDSFTKWLKSEFGMRGFYLEDIITGANLDSEGCPVPGTGGRSDLFFAVHDEDIGKFTVKRLLYGIRWLGDALAPDRYKHIYPERVFGYLTNDKKEEGEMVTKEKYIPGTEIEKPEVELIGVDGNAFAIMGNVSSALRKAGAPKEVIAKYMEESKSGDKVE